MVGTQGLQPVLGDLGLLLNSQDTGSHSSLGPKGTVSSACGDKGSHLPGALEVPGAMHALSSFLHSQQTYDGCDSDISPSIAAFLLHMNALPTPLSI